MAINMTTIEFAAWEPDQPAYGGQQALDAQNVIPGKRGYRCMPGLAKMAKPALSSSVLGAFSMKDLSGGLITVASTEHGIFSLDGAEWVQKHSGAALSSNREFVSYGDVIYALYGTILLKAEVSGAVQDFSAVKDAPAAARLGIIKDFLVLGKLSGQGNAIRHPNFPGRRECTGHCRRRWRCRRVDFHGRSCSSGYVCRPSICLPVQCCGQTERRTRFPFSYRVRNNMHLSGF